MNKTEEIKIKIARMLVKLIMCLPPTRAWDTGYGHVYKEWDYLLFKLEMVEREVSNEN